MRSHAHLGERGLGGDGHDLAELASAAAGDAHLPREEAAVPQRLGLQRAAECVAHVR